MLWFQKHFIVTLVDIVLVASPMRQIIYYKGTLLPDWLWVQ